MAGERSPIPHEKRQAILRMRKGGATYDEIARTLGVSKAFISGFLRKRDEEEQRIRAVGAPPPPAPPAAPVAAAEPDPPRQASSAEEETADDISKLEGELRSLYEIANTTIDPVERVRVSNTIGSITARLAKLRQDEAKAKPTERDELVKRAGYAAADKLRSLLEEALGERLAEE